MTIKEYKDRHGLSLRQLAERIRPVEPGITIPLLSMMYNGVAEPSENVKRWLASEEVNDINDPLSTTESIVLMHLEDATRENPVSRGYLILWAGLPDREIRHTIEKLRNRGFWIINGENGGYYITDDRDEMERWLLSYTARVKTIARTAAAMRANDPNQVKTFDF